MLSTCKHSSYISQRWVFAILSFLGLGIGSAVRSVLSITITEMAYPTHESRKSSEDRCFELEDRLPRNASSSGVRYHWDEYTQGLILSSFFWGYAPTQFIYGWLAERFGGKYFLGQAIFVPSLLSFLSPLAVEWGDASALILLRVLMGVSSSAMMPSVSKMIPQWTAPASRTRFGTFICAGFILGPVTGTILPALIIRRWGWPAVFYYFGAVGMGWFPLWALLCYESAEQHPFISEPERKYLNESLGQEVKSRPGPAPYPHILRSLEFWAFVIGLFGCDWAYFMLASDLPKYMSSVVGLAIEDNGYLSALPYLCMWLNSMLSSWLADRLIGNGLLTATRTKKALTVLAALGSAAFILAASYAGCDQLLVVGAFVASVTLMGSAYPSIMMNNLELSPNYAGSLMAIANGVAALGGVFSPYLVGILTTDQTIGEWRLVFWIGLVIAAAASLFVMLYASSDVQYWNDPDFERDENKLTTRRTKKIDVAEKSI